MEVKILLFATLKDRAGTSQLTLDAPEDTSVGQLKNLLGEQRPELKPYLSQAIVAVGQEFAFDEDLVPLGAEVALFPPVSGGNGSFPTVLQVVYDPLSMDELIAQITQPSTGAVCLFTGVVRGVTRRDSPHETASLEYEAYVPMAEAKLAQVAEEIRQRWPAVEGIAIVQRIGHLEPGTPTVLVACAASHRDTGAFEAARYGIDRLKEIVPIWKKEVGLQGDRWVEGDYTPRRGD